MKQNLNCSGSTRVDGGEYGEVRVSASLRVDGDLRCDALQCSGSAKIEGALSCAGEVRCSGSVKVAGEAAMQEGRFSGSVKAQSLHCTGTLQCSGSAKIEGGMQLGKARFSGSCAAEGDIHAEELEIGGLAVRPGCGGRALPCLRRAPDQRPAQCRRDHPVPRRPVSGGRYRLHDAPSGTGRPCDLARPAASAHWRPSPSRAIRSSCSIRRRPSSAGALSASAQAA